MTDRHLSNRFERGSREHKLVRQFEIGMSGCDMKDIALLDLNTQHDMILYCSRDDDHPWCIWCMVDDPDCWEDQALFYPTYEEAWKNFQEWSEKPVQPNWEAQAEYDELHGTVNGEDAGIVMMRELWGE